MSQGAVIKSTNLTDNFNFTDFRSCYGDSALPLVYIKNEKVVIYTGSESIPSKDIELISLLPVAAQELAKQLAEKQQKAAEEPQEKDLKEESSKDQNDKAENNPNKYEKIKTMISNTISHKGSSKKP